MNRPVDHILGGRVTWLSADSIRIGNGAVESSMMDDRRDHYIEWSGAITVNMPTDLDTGAEAADTWYALYALADSSGTNAVKGIFSTSTVAPTLPSGYDLYRRLGMVRNDDSSDFMQFVCLDTDSERVVNWQTPIGDRVVLNGGAATVETAVDCSAFVPPVAREAMIYIRQNGTPSVSIRSETAGNNIDTILSGQVITPRFILDTSQQMFYINAAAGGDVDITIRGYVDIL